MIQSLGSTETSRSHANDKNVNVADEGKISAGSIASCRPTKAFFACLLCLLSISGVEMGIGARKLRGDSHVGAAHGGNCEAKF